MICCMITDNIEHAAASTTRIMNIGNAIGITWAAMQQCYRWALRDAEIAVSHPGHHILLQTEHTPDTGYPIKRRDKMHFTRARIGKAGIYLGGNKTMDERFRSSEMRSVHNVSSRT